ncbi:MAG: hypothetical protein AB7T16_13370 [Dehalococcoidia bacterium]
MNQDNVRLVKHSARAFATLGEDSLLATGRNLRALRAHLEVLAQHAAVEPEAAVEVSDLGDLLDQVSTRLVVLRERLAE